MAESEEKVNSGIRAYFTPILTTIVGMLLWTELSDLKADVKTLLANQSANQVKIETLQTDVSALKNFVYNKNFSNEEVRYPHAQPAKKEDELTLLSR